MRKMLILSFVFLNTCLSFITSQVIINESFNNGTQAPIGWNIKIGGTYTTDINSGEQIPSIKFSATSQFVETNTFANATGFSFWTKGNSTDSASMLLFEYQTNSTWYRLDSLRNIKTGKNYEYALPDSACQLRIIYNKSAGNVAFDDLKVFRNLVITDSVAPSFSNNTPNISNIRASSCDIALELTLAGTLHYLVVPDNGISPSFKDIKESTMPNSGYISLMPNEMQKITIKALIPDTKYCVYFITIGVEPNYLCDSIIHNYYFQTKITQNDLFFSKIYKGTGNNKVIEIYNPSTDTVSLTNYRIAIATNGLGWKTSYFTFPNESVVLPKDVFVIAKTTADSSIVNFSAVDATTTSTIIAFTGNDARALQKQNDDASWSTIDIYGNPLESTNFTIAGIAEAASKFNLIRNKYITKGNADWTIAAGTDSSNSEWKLVPLSNLPNIGVHLIKSASTLNFTSFKVENQIGLAQIDTIQSTIHIKVKNYVDIKSLKCSYSVSNGLISNIDFNKPINGEIPLEIILKSNTENDSVVWVLYIQKGSTPEIKNISYESNIVTVQFDRKIRFSANSSEKIIQPLIKMLNANNKNEFPISIEIDSSESTLYIHHAQLVKSMEPFVLTIDSVIDREGNVLNNYSWKFEADIQNELKDYYDNSANVVLYPNPTKQSFKIQCQSIKTIDLTIISPDGKVLLNKKCHTNEPIEISILPKGIYFVKINLDNKKYLKSLMLN